MTRIVSDYEIFEKSSERNRRLLRQEELILEVTERLSEALVQEGITKAELARRLGKTKGFVSQILAGGRNLTLRTIADIADSLGCRIRIQVGKESQLQESAAKILPGHNGREVIPLTFGRVAEFNVTRQEQIVYAKSSIEYMQAAA